MHRVVGIPANRGAAVNLENAGRGREGARCGRLIAFKPQTTTTSECRPQPSKRSKPLGEAGDGVRIWRYGDQSQIGDRAGCWRRLRVSNHYELEAGPFRFHDSERVQRQRLRAAG